MSELKLSKDSDNFDNLAKKLRLEKFDKCAIQQYKTEAISYEKKKKKKVKSLVMIQKYFRGYLMRKKFHGILEKINTLTIIEYFRERRSDRIQQTSHEIINYYLKDYIEKKREDKRLLLKNYMQYCTSMISANWRGYQARLYYSKIIENLRESKNKILALCLGNKVRKIIKITKIQDILSEIGNIKNFFSNMNKEQRVSEKTEKLKEEFQRKLPKLEINFYNEFYKYYSSGKWTQYSRIINSCWTKYLNIIQGLIEPPRKFQIFEPIESNKRQFSNDNKFENFESKKLIKITESKKSVEKNLAQNNNTSTEFDNKPLNNGNKKYDISKLSEFPDDHVPVTNEDQVVEKIKRPAPIKRQKPKYDARKAIEEAKLKEEAMKKEKENLEIEGLKKDKLEKDKLEKDKLEKDKIEKDQLEKDQLEKSSPLRKNKFERGENKKSFEIQNEVSEIKNDSVVEFKETHIHNLHEVKELQDESINAIQNLKENLRKTTRDKIKFAKKFENDQTGSSLGQGNNQNVNNNTSTTPIFKKEEVKSLNVALRKKLHELERSPPKKIDKKNIKSRVDCWGQENKESNNNIKKLRKDDYSEPPQDEFLTEIYREYYNIEGYLNLENYFYQKEEIFRENKIPYITVNSFYVKNFSNEIYEEIKGHLHKQYQDIKNNT